MLLFDIKAHLLPNGAEFMRPFYRYFFTLDFGLHCCLFAYCVDPELCSWIGSHFCLINRD